MARHTKRALTDEQWERITAYFSEHPPSAKVPFRTSPTHTFATRPRPSDA